MGLNHEVTKVILGCKFYGRISLLVHCLSLRYSRPSSLYNVSLDVKLIAPVTARVAL